jgi:hypothetical protein
MVRHQGVAGLRVVEASSSPRSYHLRDGDEGNSLCGIAVVPATIPTSAWGTVSHVRERWCKYCAEAAGLVTKEKKS